MKAETDDTTALLMRIKQRLDWARPNRVKTSESQAYADALQLAQDCIDEELKQIIESRMVKSNG